MKRAEICFGRTAGGLCFGFKVFAIGRKVRYWYTFAAAERDEGGMMPLIYAETGEANTIKKVGGSPEVRAHLENLGFVPGGLVTVIATMGGNLIVNVKESRIAISREMAGKIMV